MLRFRVVAVLLLLVAACGPAPEESLDGDWPDRSPRFDVVEELRADLLRPRSAADGGGTATVEALRGPAVAGSPGSWRIVYRAGPAGVAVGGTVHLQVSPFWGWSTPQTERREALGYTTIETAAVGVELSAETLDQQLLAIGVGGRPLAEGEEVVITYGAGPAGALADRYAERESRFWVAVDGDGDGVRELIAESPAVDVKPGPPARLLLHVPSTARPGDRVTLTAALVDAAGNGWPAASGTLELRLPAGVDLVESGTVSGHVPARLVSVRRPSGRHSGAEVEPVVSLALAAEDRGRLVVPLRLSPEAGGVIRVSGRLTDAAAESGLEAESNPLVVAPAGRRILWADLQHHSGLSDGSATPDDLLLYAREVAGLDAAAVTDHDHWGMRFMDGEPSIWRRTLDAAESAQRTGPLRRAGRLRVDQLG